MTLYVNVGRRVPRSWGPRVVKKIGGLMTFQENMWLMIKGAFAQGQKKLKWAAENDPKWYGCKAIVTKDEEMEDLNYKLEWIKVIIQGTEEQEKDQYEATSEFYKQLGHMFKKDYPKDENMMKHFKTKILSGEKVKEAYEKGYGAVSDNNIANKLLEMGILTHIDWQKDFDTRPPV